MKRFVFISSVKVNGESTQTGQDLSTTELVRGMARAAGVPARLLPVPVWALQAGATLLGKGDAVQRLAALR